MSIEKDWIGKVWRYSSGPTALFLCNTVVDHGNDHYRMYGQHCLGGRHSATPHMCTHADVEDITTWNKHAHDRLGWHRGFNLFDHLTKQREWSAKTFGPGERTAGVVDHIRKELKEIIANPTDVSEWIDVVILALDGAWRVGATQDDIIGALIAKQNKNESRQWPDWRTAEPGKAIEHVRNTHE